MTTVPVVPRRERARAATIAEIKRTALDLLREQGTTDVRFTDIARVMGMTPPALYRYFDDRDALLTALITDAYDDLGSTIAQAQEPLPADDVGARWRAGAEAYRRWARDEPERFALIFGLPVSGFCAPEEGETTEAARRALYQLSSLFVQAQAQGRLGPALHRDVDPSVEVCAEGKSEDLEVVVPAENFQAMMHAWTSIHGFACLETYGHLDWMPPEARDALFATQVTLAGHAAGLPPPESS